MPKTLIAYATKGGVAEEIATIVAEVLRDTFKHDVDLVDLRHHKRNIDVSAYDNFIAGGGVRMQRVYRNLYRFLRLHDLEGKAIALFVVCNEAGNLQKLDETRSKYVGKVQNACPRIRVICPEVFGGRMRMFGKVVDVRDMERVREWANGLPGMLPA